ncbi:hypothetical protein BV25DRAFT_1988736 [Artomyces pyxidatus]|uniref:Uncharacterized protein n=1 Tax=Artomyces pyxidatus TaxID=48021 RepID=A0ACB8TDC0_9AGAM|nr:hypothetical protein BV25DRAFT_1988736 [Artomyces pyxidatus]
MSTSNNPLSRTPPSPPSTTEGMQAIPLNPSTTPPLTPQDEFFGAESLVVAPPSWETLYDGDGTRATGVNLWNRKVERAEEAFIRMSNGVDSFEDQLRQKALGLHLAALEEEEHGSDESF